MYIGSLKPRAQLREWMAENNRIVEKNDVVYSDGLLRIFIEALSNSIDNVWRSRQAGLRPSKIRVTIDPLTGETVLWNDGLHIPIEMHAEEKIYNPELIFGHLLSGSNLDDSEARLSSGRNGLGIKLLNVFSTEFHIECGDPVHRKLYRQSWYDNMRRMEAPVLKAYSLKTGYTCVRWKPDFEKFEMPNKVYDSTILSLYEKYCMDAAMITGIAVSVNDKKFHFKTFLDYVRLYAPEEDEVSTTPVHAVSFTMDSSDNNEPYKTQYVIMESPTQEYKEIGFINGIYTRDGGVHIDSASSELWKSLIPRFSGGKSGGSVNAKDLKPHFMIFVNAWAPNPEFSSQSKTKLLAPSIPVSIEARHLNQIMRWPFVEKINDLLRSKELLSLKKTEKKARGFKRIEGLDHANLAGSKNANHCTLILCEGLSAKTYAVKGINVGWNGRKGRDYYGIYALRGKLLNVRNATVSSISNNREITDIIQALGLRYDVDYSSEEALKTLQYGRVMILTDADEDGHHICSLIVNLFHKLFPSLLRSVDHPPFLWLMMTPIARIFYSPSRQECFYNDHDYRRALEDPSFSQQKIKYYKGLGTSSDAEIRETFGQKVVSLVMDDLCNNTMDMAFHKMLSQDRKEWLAKYDPTVYTVPESTYLISQYVNQELIKFSIEDCSRSIPNLFDGLKKSQRKILYSVFKRRLNHEGKSMKVAQLAGYCAETSNYHHGEQCLFDTIVRMSQDFPGSNNVPYFEKDGQFGSLAYGGKDAANARYIFTKCAALTRLLFPEEDDALLTYTYDDGDKVEPDYYLPILPTILGNGCTAGIGTGWSCSVPCHDFLQLSDKVKGWLARREAKDIPQEDLDIELLPSYRGFKGLIEKLDKNKYQSTGIMEEVRQGRGAGKLVYKITCLPIGTWTNKYKEDLEVMMEQKKLKSIKNYSTPDTVHFELEAAEDFKPTIDNMKLRSTISSTNMVLFTDSHRLQRYDSLRNIFEVFCEMRLALYGERKKARIQRLEIQLMVEQNKKRFLEEVDRDILRVFRVREEEVLKQLVERDYTPDPRKQASAASEDEGASAYRYLLQIPIRDVSLEKMEVLAQKIDQLKKDLLRAREMTDIEMWRVDLDQFITAYKKVYASSLTTTAPSST
jgi:DNA topoisomerase-2